MLPAHIQSAATRKAVVINTMMVFKVGDKVVHPQHGVGHVVKMEDREFEPGVIKGYYEISIPGGSTLWAPVDLQTSGLRKLAQKNEIARCRKILESRPSPLLADPRLRQTDLSDRLNWGHYVRNVRSSVICMRMVSINRCMGRSPVFSVRRRMYSVRSGQSWRG